jgi:hypothetical protein
MEERESISLICVVSSHTLTTVLSISTNTLNDSLPTAPDFLNCSARTLRVGRRLLARAKQLGV